MRLRRAPPPPVQHAHAHARAPDRQSQLAVSAFASRPARASAGFGHVQTCADVFRCVQMCS
eukprot:8776560-Alexandrium_andersonii.AAC.1